MFVCIYLRVYVILLNIQIEDMIKFVCPVSLFFLAPMVGFHQGTPQIVPHQHVWYDITHSIYIFQCARMDALLANFETWKQLINY